MTKESKTAVRNDREHEAFLASVRGLRLCQVRTARILFTLYEGCENIAEFGARHGLSPAEARRLMEVGRALESSPEFERLFLDGLVSLEAAAIVGRALSNPDLVRDGDRWADWARTSSERELRKLLRKRMEEARME